MTVSCGDTDLSEPDPRAIPSGSGPGSGPGDRVDVAPVNARPRTSEPEPPPRPDDAPRGALVALGLAALVAVLDGTVVTVALGSLATDLHASLPTVLWATVGYLLAAATTLPMLGWATGRFGGRVVFLAGLALFCIGSALSALAWSALALIAFRALQGLGGGLLEPTSLMLAARLVRPERVGKVLGTMSMIINVAPAAGPVTGGLLLATGHWQWIFLVNIPLCVGLLVVALLYIPDDRPARDRQAPGPTLETPAHAPSARADVRGLALLTPGYVGILFALTRAGQVGADPVVAVVALAGAAMLAGYTWHALTTTAMPAFDLRLLRRPGFGACLAVMSCVGLVMYGQQSSLPLVGADRYGLRGAAQGLLVCALGLGLFVSMSWGGRISDRTGPRPLVLIGAGVTAAGLATFAATHDRLPLAGGLLLFLAVGLGFGATASPTFSSVYRILPPADQPQGTTALFIALQLSASLGVTLLGVLQARGSGTAWLTWLYVLLAGAAVLVLAMSRALPGRPAAPGAG